MIRQCLTVRRHFRPFEQISTDPAVGRDGNQKRSDMQESPPSSKAACPVGTVITS